MDELRDWVEGSPYGRSLGVQLAGLADGAAELLLPYREANSNPGRALHGGCAASLGVIGGQVLARHALGPESGPWHTCSFQIGYLSAAIGEAVLARARLLRRGKELCFVATEVETREGKAIATATSVVRGRFRAAPPQLATSRGDAGASVATDLGVGMGKLPFIGGRAIRVENLSEESSRLVMPRVDQNLDVAGHLHEGAVCALIDTTGACAAWATSGIGPYKASTAAIQVQQRATTPAVDLVAYGRCVQRDGEIFFTEVEVANAADGRISASGNVLYRIVT